MDDFTASRERQGRVRGESCGGKRTVNFEGLRRDLRTRQAFWPNKAQKVLSVHGELDKRQVAGGD